MFDKYYKILNLNNNASEEEIKKSYKSLEQYGSLGSINKLMSFAEK